MTSPHARERERYRDAAARLTPRRAREREISPFAVTLAIILKYLSSLVMVKQGNCIDPACFADSIRICYYVIANFMAI